MKIIKVAGIAFGNPLAAFGQGGRVFGWLGGLKTTVSNLRTPPVSKTLREQLAAGDITLDDLRSAHRAYALQNLVCYLAALYALGKLFTGLPVVAGLSCFMLQLAAMSLIVATAGKAMSIREVRAVPKADFWKAAGEDLRVFMPIFLSVPNLKIREKRS